jgi:hypothetical protein
MLRLAGGHTLKTLIALLACSGFALADSVTYESSATLQQEPWLSPGSLTIYIPQFDPSLGSLDGLSFKFTDQMTVQAGFNDFGSPDKSSFTFNLSGTDTESSNLLGIHASASELPLNVVVYNEDGENNWQDITNGPLEDLTLQDSGNLSGQALQPFEGTGLIGITISPTAKAWISNSDPNNDVEAGVDEITSFADLIVTYDVATPEPRALWLLPLLILVFRMFGHRLLKELPKSN